MLWPDESPKKSAAAHSACVCPAFQDLCVPPPVVFRKPGKALCRKSSFYSFLPTVLSAEQVGELFCEPCGSFAFEF